MFFSKITSVRYNLVVTVFSPFRVEEVDTIIKKVLYYGENLI
ncbi:unknown [Bacteroides sp. CAG:754]|jgi:hypothetical protein|nr:unknown [Bacteroides sp. CAG:754]